MKLNQREITTIIGALRLLQMNGTDGSCIYSVPRQIVEILYIESDVPPILKEEIDNLCERLNLG